jgi:hypothetical protein
MCFESSWSHFDAILYPRHRIPVITYRSDATYSSSLLYANRPVFVKNLQRLMIQRLFDDARRQVLLVPE